MHLDGRTEPFIPVSLAAILSVVYNRFEATYNRWSQRLRLIAAFLSIAAVRDRFRNP